MRSMTDIQQHLQRARITTLLLPSQQPVERRHMHTLSCSFKGKGKKL
jgi:hypothetical protein